MVPKVTATCIGNAKYFGGGMKITPTADPFNGRLEVFLQKLRVSITMITHSCTVLLYKRIMKLLFLLSK